MQNIIDTEQGIKLLKETHLKGVTLPTKWHDFKFAVVQGEPKAPYAINLYLSAIPALSDDYLRITFNHDAPVYCEYQEFDGKTDKQK